MAATKAGRNRTIGQAVVASAPYEDSTRERILIEASRLFADRGYHRTSTRDIAKSIGIRQPSLFHHFPSKAAIMEALLALNFDRAVRFATAMVDQPGSPAARLFCVFRADLKYLTSLPYDLSGTMRGEVLRDPGFAHWERQHKRLHRSWLSLVDQGIEAGQFAALDKWLVEHAVEGIFGELIRAAAHPSAREKPPASSEMVRFILRCFLADPRKLAAIAAEADTLEKRSTLTY